jgi:hypothetical protein
MEDVACGGDDRAATAASSKTMVTGEPIVCQRSMIPAFLTDHIPWFGGGYNDCWAPCGDIVDNRALPMLIPQAVVDAWAGADKDVATGCLQGAGCLGSQSEVVGDCGTIDDMPGIPWQREALAVGGAATPHPHVGSAAGVGGALDSTWALDDVPQRLLHSNVDVGIWGRGLIPQWCSSRTQSPQWSTHHEVAVPDYIARAWLQPHSPPAGNLVAAV